MFGGRGGTRSQGLLAAVLAVTLALWLVLAGDLRAARALETLAPIVLWPPDEYHTGGAYTAIQAAPDGSLYLGTTYYDGFGRLLVLPPGGREWRVITDTGTATGDRTTGPYSQAKIHTKPVIAPDGKVFFGTKVGQTVSKAPGSYRGGYLLVYDPATRRVTNLGMPRPHQSIIAVGLDVRRGVVYALSDPEGHLVAYDLRTRRFDDKGELKGPEKVTRYLVVLANGDVFHSAGEEAVMRYRAAADRIERLPLRFTGQGRYEPPYALAANPDGMRFHGVGMSSGQVYTYVPGEREVVVQLHGARVPEGESPPGTHYTMTAAPDGTIYYTGVFGPSLYLLRLDPRAGRPEVVGRVEALPATPGRPFARHIIEPAKHIIVQGSTAAPDGTLYVMTAYPLRVLVFPRLAARR